MVAVGGTTLNLTASNQWASETGWSYFTDPTNYLDASGGGTSNTYSEPSYQEGVQTSNFRTVPDVSSDANPQTGVSVYDPYDSPTGPWLIRRRHESRDANLGWIDRDRRSGRVLAGGTPLSGPTQTLPDLYSLQNYSTNFHDITKGYNGFEAGPGYDLVTGIGTPRANNLLPALSSYGLASQAVITAQPPSSVIAGGVFGTIVSAEDAAGVVDPSFGGTATIALASGPAGAVFAPVTVSVTNGLAVFDGLSLSQLSGGTDYTFHITFSNPLGPTLTTNHVDVAAPATPGVGVYYPLPIDSSLRNGSALPTRTATRPITSTSCIRPLMT